MSICRKYDNLLIIMEYLLSKSALIIHNALTDAVPYPDAPITDNDTISTAKEISEILKISDGAVRQLLFRGRKALQEFCGDSK